MALESRDTVHLADRCR